MINLRGYQQLIAVDPGKSLGYAFWYAYHFDAIACPPNKSGVIKGKTTFRGDDEMVYAEKMADCMHRLHKEIDTEVPTAIVCEWPSYFQSAKGQKSADRGDLVKLSVAVGMVAGLAAQVGAVFYPVRVNTWKGQLSKATVIRRIKRQLGDKACSGFVDDEWDAVGVGLWAKRTLCQS